MVVIITIDVMVAVVVVVAVEPVTINSIFKNYVGYSRGHSISLEKTGFTV